LLLALQLLLIPRLSRKWQKTEELQEEESNPGRRKKKNKKEQKRRRKLENVRESGDKTLKM